MSCARFIAAIAATIALSAGDAQAATLITPQGTPVGGVWQRWVNDAKVPTISGPILFQTVEALGCEPAPSCSAAGGQGTPPVIAATSRGYLYFELGHLFNTLYLTGADRARFARMWGHPHAQWADSARSLSEGSEDGLTADFAAVYEQCAEGLPEIGEGWPRPNGVLMPPNIRPMRSGPSCALIRRAAN